MFLSELPAPECSDLVYRVLNDQTRSVKYYGNKHKCDYTNPPLQYTKLYGTQVSPDWQTPGWYRFEEPAGTILPLSPQRQGSCGTAQTGWTNATLPAIQYERKDIPVCFHWRNNVCFTRTQAKVTNCGSYFVYYFVNTPGCNIRYCGITPTQTNTFVVGY